MSKIVVIAFIVYFGGPAVCQIETPDFLRLGFRWMTEQQPQITNQISEVLKEAKHVESENSVHLEKILKNPAGFLSASVKKAIGIIRKEEDVSVHDKTHKRTNLIEIAKSLNLTTFLEKAKDAGIDDILDHEGKFTVFAPTNEAFERTPKFCANIKVKDLMKFHVSKGSVASSDFKNNLILRTLLTRRGTRINIYQNGTVLTANGRKINATDFKASNGILHVIDDVMCAVYRGSAVFAINRCPKLTMLAKAINITDLYTPLTKTRRLTLFAPTDAAFAKIPADILDNLFKNVTALTELLTYHVVPEVWYSPGLEDGQTLVTLQGGNVTIGVNGNVTVDGAIVVAADATVSNGVVHGIDTVMVPEKAHWMKMQLPEKAPWMQPVVLVV